MQKRLRNVVRKGLGEFTIPLLTVETKVDMAEGLLFGLDENGMAVIADATISAPIHAVGIVDRTSTEPFGSAFKLNGDNILRKGEHVDVYTHAVLYASKDEVGSGKVGDPVYLGAGGKVTLTAPATSTNIVQKVGILANPKTGAVRLSIGDKGTAVS